jgi:thiol-disulfide isomerase/thioredoxin
MEKPGGPATVLAIGEPWCPDVFRGMPVIAKLCEATGLDLKIFFRDQNLDIMNEFLYKDEFQSIPTLVFYDKDMNKLGVWHERAQKARDEMPQLSAITSKMRDQELSEEQRAQYMEQYAEFQKGPVWGGWREAEVKEIRELLESATS